MSRLFPLLESESESAALLPLFVPNNFVVYAIYSFLSAVETKKHLNRKKRDRGQRKIIVVEL